MEGCRTHLMAEGGGHLGLSNSFSLWSRSLHVWGILGPFVLELFRVLSLAAQEVVSGENETTSPFRNWDSIMSNIYMWPECHRYGTEWILRRFLIPVHYGAMTFKARSSRGLTFLC